MKIKTTLAALALATVMASSAMAATITVFETDIATSCETAERIDWRCGVGSINSALTNDFKGEGTFLEQKSALEFSLDQIDYAESAVLRFKNTGYINSYANLYEIPILEIHGYNGDGVIEYSDLNTNNLILTTQPIDHLGWYEFDVTEYLNTANSNGATHVGFAFRAIVMGSGAVFYSNSEQATSMVVQTVPIPAAAWLFGSALIGLAGIKRKK